MPLRALNPDDAEAYRDLRLTALRESPTAFGSSEQDELNRSPSETAARLRTTENDFVLGLIEGERLLGMVGLHRFQNVKERHKGIMWGMYVRPEARRAGVGRALVAELVRRAQAMPGLLQVNLAVERDNRPATALYRAFGFEAFGVEERALIIGGVPYAEVHMVLRLDRV